MGGGLQGTGSWLQPLADAPLKLQPTPPRQVIGIHLDAFSVAFILFNFSVRTSHPPWAGAGGRGASLRRSAPLAPRLGTGPNPPCPVPPPNLPHPQVVGVVGLFFAPVPLLLKQAYLVWTGIITGGWLLSEHFKIHTACATQPTQCMPHTPPTRSLHLHLHPRVDQLGAAGADGNL